MTNQFNQSQQLTQHDFQKHINNSKSYGQIMVKKMNRTSKNHMNMYQSKVNIFKSKFNPSQIYYALNHSQVFKAQAFTLKDLIMCQPTFFLLVYPFSST